MAAITMTMPSGAKLRTATSRRLVLIEEGAKGPFIIKRSHKRDVLMAEDRRLRNKGYFGPRYIGDTVTKEVTKV